VKNRCGGEPEPEEPFTPDNHLRSCEIHRIFIIFDPYSGFPVKITGEEPEDPLNSKHLKQKNPRSCDLRSLFFKETVMVVIGNAPLRKKSKN
jgi:hypothetical protein